MVSERVQTLDCVAQWEDVCLSGGHLESKYGHLEGSEGLDCGESWWLARGLAWHRREDHEGQAFLSYPYTALNSCFLAEVGSTSRIQPGVKSEKGIAGALGQAGCSSAPPEPASPLLLLNTCMEIAVCGESRELIELVLEGSPIHSLKFSYTYPKGCVLPASAVEVYSSTGSPPVQCKATQTWAVDGMGEGLRRAEDAPLHHWDLLCCCACFLLVSR